MKILSKGFKFWTTTEQEEKIAIFVRIWIDISIDSYTCCLKDIISMFCHTQVISTLIQESGFWFKWFAMRRFCAPHTVIFQSNLLLFILANKRATSSKNFTTALLLGNENIVNDISFAELMWQDPGSYLVRNYYLDYNAPLTAVHKTDKIHDMNNKWINPVNQVKLGDPDESGELGESGAPSEPDKPGEVKHGGRTSRRSNMRPQGAARYDLEARQHW